MRLFSVIYLVLMSLVFFYGVVKYFKNKDRNGIYIHATLMCCNLIVLYYILRGV